MQKNLDDSVQKSTATNAAAQFGINRFSDLTADEFSVNHLNRNLSHMVAMRLESIKNQTQQNLSSLVNVADIELAFTDNNRFDRYPLFYNMTLMRKNLNFLPLKVDWFVCDFTSSSRTFTYIQCLMMRFSFPRRNENVLQKVRLQGTCGICWAYSVIEMMEAHLAIHHNIRRKLSVQQMVDCARNGNDGCNGGDNCLLLEWLTYGRVNIRSDEEYPVSNSGEVEPCQVSANDTGTGLEVFKATNFTCNR